MANKMPANNAISSATTENNRQISQPNTIDFATNTINITQQFEKLKAGWRK